MRCSLGGRSMILAGLCVVAAFDSALLAEEPIQHHRAVELVRLLGDDSFQVRQRATREIQQLGVPAKEALLAGLKDSDAEIRRRCRHVLESVLELDLRARLARFAADQDGSEGLSLPCWDRFRQMAGEDPVARELFVEMQRAEPDLLQAVDSPGNLLNDAIQNRCAQIQQVIFAPDPRARGSVPLGSVMALFFAGAQAEVQVTDALVSYLHTFSYQPAFAQAMADPRRSAPLRKLLGAWVGRNSDSLSTYHNFMLALQYGLDQALSPAVTALRAGTAQPYAEQYALLVVGRFGTVEHTSLVEPLLEDQSVLGTNNVNQQEVRTEVRDVALAILVHLAGQDHAEYGFQFLQKNSRSVIQPLSAGFASDDARGKAIRRWRERTANPADD